MNIILQILLLFVSVFFLVFVLYRVRKGKYLLKYSFVWIVLSVIGVFASCFPQILAIISNSLGFYVTSNFVYFVLIVFLLIWNLILCGILSKQETSIKSLVQELSIVQALLMQSSDQRRLERMEEGKTIEID